jgi:hypothetical protein
MLDILHGVSLTVAPGEIVSTLLADPEVKRLYLGG